VAEQLAISPEEINELTFGLMLNVLRGDGGGGATGKNPPPPKLRLVKS